MREIGFWPKPAASRSALGVQHRVPEMRPNIRHRHRESVRGAIPGPCHGTPRSAGYGSWGSDIGLWGGGPTPSGNIPPRLRRFSLGPRTSFFRPSYCPQPRLDPTAGVTLDTIRAGTMESAVSSRGCAPPGVQLRWTATCPGLGRHHRLREPQPLNPTSLPRLPLAPRRPGGLGAGGACGQELLRSALATAPGGWMLSS